MHHKYQVNYQKTTEKNFPTGAVLIETASFCHIGSRQAQIETKTDASNCSRLKCNILELEKPGRLCHAVPTAYHYHHQTYWHLKLYQGL